MIKLNNQNKPKIIMKKQNKVQQFIKHIKTMFYNNVTTQCRKDSSYLWYFSYDDYGYNPYCILIAKDEEDAMRIFNELEEKEQSKRANPEDSETLMKLHFQDDGNKHYYKIFLREKLKLKNNEKSRIIKYRCG